MVIDHLQWLKENPAFRERPASLLEFLGPDYLNCDRMIRKRIKKELAKIVGDEVGRFKPTMVSKALITGGIGIGKTTIASILLPYLVHWMLCLKNPQEFFELLPGSRIAFMQMSTTEKQAREVVFGDIQARIENSPWFQTLPDVVPEIYTKEFRGHPYDPSFKNQIRFPLDIWILPGDSKDTSFEGYNIFGGILDEADSHTVTETKDYAEMGYDTIENRMSSRFGDKGFLLVIGQKKSSVGFVARKQEELSEIPYPEAYTVSLSIWESYGMDNERFRDAETGEFKTFLYDTRRKMVIPSGAGRFVDSESIIEIPNLYKRNFTTNPQKALKDLAGMPQLVTDPFISMVNKIEMCRDRWKARYPDFDSPMDIDGRLATWFRAPNTLPRCAHIDLAYAAEGDRCGLAVGHVAGMAEVDGELKPHIVIDLLAAFRAPAGGEIFIGSLRAQIYNMIDNLGFRINKVTMDGFESTDSIQQFKRRRIGADYVSMDREVLPYHDLREAIYEERIDFPPYMIYVQNNNGVREVEILVKELSELMDNGKKIDHPVNGSKDVADAVAGVTFTLMGDRTYRRTRINMSSSVSPQKALGTGQQNNHPAFRGQSGSAPLPPSTAWSPYESNRR